MGEQIATGSHFEHEPEAALVLPEALLWQRAGFTVRLRHATWWDCLLSDGHGNWCGHGSTAEAALTAALEQMVPGRRALELLRQAVVAAAARDVAPELHEPPVLDPAPAPPAPAEIETDALVPALVEPETEPTASAASQELAPRSPARPRQPSPDPEDALHALQVLLREVQAAAADLAELAPRRIQLVLLGWIARARAWEDRLPGLVTIEHSVHAIARELQRYSSEFWPGNVTALQRAASPASVRPLLRLEDRPAPRDWSEAAEQAERALELEEADRRLDEEGWADMLALNPRPVDPAGLLREVQSHVERLCGTLEGQPCDPGTRGSLKVEDRAQLIEQARRLRWLRGQTSDPITWGRLMGRQRWLAERYARKFPDLLGMLDPTHRPQHTWAAELGQHPQEKRRRRLRKTVLLSRPDGRIALDDLLAWLLLSFDALDTPELAALLRGHAEAVAALGPERMPDRRRRGRLKRLQEYLADGTRDEEKERSIIEQAEAATAADSGDDESEAPGRAAVTVPDPLETLRQRVLPRTHGQRILFVSNREDPQLRQSLQERLEPGDLAWCDGKSRRVASEAERVASGQYDIVLCATGFISHAIEYTLLEACRSRRVPYVRAYKGRVASCLRALERDLGLGSQ